MSFISTQANRISATENTGLIRSSISKIDPIKGVSAVLVNTSAQVIHGDNDGSGLKYTDITTAVNNFTENDVALFNTTNPNDDRLCVRLATGDDIQHVGLLIGTAGVYTGTLQAALRYKKSSDNTWTTTTFANIDLTTTGVKTISGSINYADIALTDSLLDPASNPQDRCVYVVFQGLTAVTTPPLASRLWLHRKDTATKIYTDFTNLVKGDYTGTATLQLFPQTGDVSLVGFAAPFAKMYSVITRPRFASWQTKLIYSKADGTFADLPTANILATPSGVSNDELWTAAASATEYADVFIPPSDWGATTVDGVSAYYLGWQYTADATSPQLILQAKIQAQIFNTTAIGMSTGETATYTKFEASVNETSPSDTTILLANDRTGKSATVKILANQTTSESTISLAVTPTDQILQQVLISHTLITPADLIIKLS